MDDQDKFMLVLLRVSSTMLERKWFDLLRWTISCELLVADFYKYFNILTFSHSADC